MQTGICRGVLLLYIGFCSALLTQAKTVTLGGSDNHTDVALILGDTLVVELPLTLPGQYKWISHLEKGSPLTALNESFVPSNKTKDGSGTQQFRYNAAIVGETKLLVGFEVEKNGGPAPQTTSTFSVKVRVASGAPAGDEAILLGVYKGTLPCADCSGLDTVLRLYAAGKFDTRYAFYVRTQTYRGAPHGDVTYSDRGRWPVLRGDSVDPDATVYQLDPDDETRSQSFLLQKDGDALTQLDREQRPIETKMNLTLRKVQ